MCAVFRFLKNVSQNVEKYMALAVSYRLYRAVVSYVMIPESRAADRRTVSGSKISESAHFQEAWRGGVTA